MPRNPILVAGLQLLAQNLPKVSGAIFEASVVQGEATYRINDEGYLVVLEKTGFTATGFRNIRYSVIIMKGTDDTGMRLGIYVVKPSTDTTVNRKAVVDGVNHLLRTPETVLMSNQEIVAS